MYPLSSLLLPSRPGTPGARTGAIRPEGVVVLTGVPFVVRSDTSVRGDHIFRRQLFLHGGKLTGARNPLSTGDLDVVCPPSTPGS